jgi:hypothetical protein
VSDVYLRENGRGELVEVSRVNGELLAHFGVPKVESSFWCADCPGDFRCCKNPTPRPSRWRRLLGRVS